MILFAKAPSFHRFALWLLLAIAAISGGQAQSDYRMNIGTNKTWTDGQGRFWGPDRLSIGRPSNAVCTGDPIAGTSSDFIYCSNRFFTKATSNNGPFLLDVPVAQAGNYLVRLHFAETHFTAAGSRIFDVYVQGSMVLTRLDLVANVGYKTAFVHELTVSATTKVSIELVAVKQNPIISAIELLLVSPGTPVPPPIPVPAPVPVPAPRPVPVPVPAPMPVPTPVAGLPPTASFQDLLINCGGGAVLESAGVRTWKADQYFSGGGTYTKGSQPIDGTLDDSVYQSERNGNFEYVIPLPLGDYEIILHFAEVYFTAPQKRVFTINVEGQIFDNIDLFQVVGYAKAFTLVVPKVVDDGFANIALTSITNKAKLSGIEIKLKEVHAAHAVSGGPYTVVDSDNDGNGVVSVDSSPSHTHGPGQVLTSWVWKKGATVVGTGEITQLTLPVGVHDVALTVTDSSNSKSTELTKITVLAFGYPAVESLSPAQGSVAGNYEVTITGSGFSATPVSQIVVHFGLTKLSGPSAVQVVNDSTIKVMAPTQAVAVPVEVSVESLSLNAKSNGKTFTYQTATPIAWTEKLIAGIPVATVAAFSPNGKLYVGTSQGQIVKLGLDGNFNVVDSVVKVIDANRAILGMAFDPMTTADDPDPWVYFSASDLFHKGSQSSSGNAINGKIMRARGANLDVVENVVTGLPVADMDHAVNGIVFGNNGELYIQIGSNTNAGIPGPLTGNQIQKENYFSAATNVAYLSDPGFNGNIQYSKPDDGVPTTTGVEVFAHGSRNPFGICMHSNGNLYGTDNGPNLGYGLTKTGCGSNDFGPEVETEDKINLLVKGAYYGHPNMLRATSMNQPRQCRYRAPTEPKDADYTPPLVIAPSSTGAVCEFDADHFGGQLRGSLIYSKYTSRMYRVILSPDGKSVVPQSNPPLSLIGKKGLGVAQAPDGSLVQVQYSVNEVWVFIPSEAASSNVRVNAVWPRRGPQAGGSTLTVYGRNLKQTGKTTTVKVGNSNCPLTSSTATEIKCTLPGGTPGSTDVVVTVGTESYTFSKGYRFITGVR